MSSNIIKYLIAAPVLLLIGSTAGAETMNVSCGGQGSLTSINAALKALERSEEHGPATINVSGACHENVQIKDIDRLTLNAINGASITDTTKGVIETIGIYRGTGITLNGLTVNGGNDAISIGQASVVLHGVTAQGAVADGVGVYVGGNVFIDGGTLQDNGYAGLLVIGGDANAAGVTTQRNLEGIAVNRAGRASYRASEPFYDGGRASAPAIITHNYQFGIVAEHNGEINCASCEITFNKAGGVSLDLGATASFGRNYLPSGQLAAPLTITDNGGPGVTLGDLSSATFPLFAANGLIQRNGGAYEIACNTPTSVTRRAQLFAPGATNCTN